jgi:biopolymer transport protein ExbD
MPLKTSHKIEPGHFSMSAMSDIAFLLIIFFMVCGNFAQQRQAEVELPLASRGEEADKLPIEVVIDEEGQIVVGDVVTRVEDLKQELRSRIRTAETTDQKTVIVRADRKLNYEQIKPVVDAVNAGGGMLELAVLQP